MTFVFTPIGESQRRRRNEGGGTFGGEPIDGAPAFRFTPVEAAAPEASADERPSVFRNVLLNNPLTAAGEAGLNLASQAVALPVAGLAGIGAAAGNALGLTDKTGADVVHAVGNALTYQPRGEFGKAAAGIVAAPFEALAKVGEHAGDAVLDATGSPIAATAVDTAINAAPMAIGPVVKGARAKFTRSDAPASQAGRGAVEMGEAIPEATPPRENPAAAILEGREVSSVPREPASGFKFTPVDEKVQPVRAAPDAAADSWSAFPPESGSLRIPRVDMPQVDAAHRGAMVQYLEGKGIGRRTVDTLPADQLKPTQAEYSPEKVARAAERTDGERSILASSDGYILDGHHQWEAARQAGDPVKAIVFDAPMRDLLPQAREFPSARAAEGAMPATATVVTPEPQPRAARYALVEADKLKATHDVDMHPREGHPFASAREGATRSEHENAVGAITSEPDPLRLMDAMDDAEGAPIVRTDGVVEAGQRRAVALQRIYSVPGQKAATYREALASRAADFGLDPADVQAMKKPVLVRVPEEPATQAMAAGTQNATWNPGANYQPFVDMVKPVTSKAASVAELPTPLRREAIISDFAKAIGTTIYEGRVKGKNRLGFFRRGVEEVRTKHANDLETAAHEVAHLIDSRVPELRAAWQKDKALADELKSVSYDQKSVTEGFAEVMRLYLTQPETLEARAPKAYAWIEDFAGRHSYGPALKATQGKMTAWFGQDALNRARSKIGSETPLAEYFDGFWDKFRQSTVDDLHGIYRMERSMTGKINANGPYESARLSRASASIADGAVRFGHPVKLHDGSFKFQGKGLKEILEPVAANLDDTLLYFVGRSAGELLAQKREHLFTRGEVDAMLRLRTPERAKAFADYQEWNKGILDFAEAQGVINPEARRLWQRTQYLPFHRVDQPGGLKGKPGDWAGIQALTGGTTNIKDVLGNMINNAAMLLDKAVKNEARRKVANLAAREGGAKFMVKIEPGERIVKIGGDQVIEAILKKFGIAIDGDAPAFFEFLIKGQPPAGNNVVAVMQSGKPIWYEVGDPILYRALKAIDRPLMSSVVKVLGWPKRIGQLTITATPDFWVANMARDTIMGGIMSRSGFRPVIDSLKGMHSRMTSDPAYRDYLANGGGLSSIFLDETHLKTKLEKYYRNQKIDYRTVLDTPDKIATMVETLGDAFEMSTRLGEYKRAIAHGENPRHAAYQGREVSTDFAARGDSKALGFMYDTVMFLKPAVVSWDRLYRGLAHDPNKGAIAAKAGTIAAMSAALYLLNRDNEKYTDLPDWDRDANWHFFIGDQHLRWPKIWEIGALASAAERTTEKLVSENPDGLGADFARIIGQTFGVNLMPQIAAPLVEQHANRSSFTGAPIETPGMENVQPFLRSKPGTSETMKAIGMATRNNPEWAQVNPVRAEALLRGYFNTWAMYGLMLSDQARYGDQLPEKRADELPVIRRFIASDPAKHTRYESQFYDLLAEAKRLRGTLKELDDMGRSDLADEKEKHPLAGEAKPLERAAKNLSAINRDMEDVRRDGTLSRAEKRRRLDELTVERNALLKAAVQDSKAAQAALNH